MAYVVDGLAPTHRLPVSDRRGRSVGRTGAASLRLVAFGALALLVSQRYAALDLGPPRGRVLGAVLVATATAALLVAIGSLASRAPAGGRTRGLLGSVAYALVLLLGLWLGLRAVGVPGRLLWPEHWVALNDRIDEGLNGLAGWLWPYRGGERWARLDVLMVIPVALTAAVALAFWPGERLLAARRAGALALLVGLYLGGVVNASHSGWIAEGVLLLAAIAAWVYLPGLGAQTGIAAATWLAVGAAVAVAASSVLTGGAPWLDYRAWNPTATVATGFQWDQAYGPITWSRSTAKMLDVVAQAPEHWKVTSLDRFDGRRFERSASPPGGFDIGSRPGDGTWYYQATFTIGGLRSRMLVGAGSAVEIGWLSNHSQDVTVTDDETAVAREPLAPGDRYQLTFYEPHPSPAQMRAASAVYPRPYLYYTQVGLPATATASASVLRAPAPGKAPAGDPAGVRRVLASPYAPVYRLARELARGQRTPYDVAARIESFLKQGYTYDEHPPYSQLPLLSFLFTDRRGYCQQFSGAMALMLRMDGIPARVAAGFLPGTAGPSGGSYRVRAVDAHSWVEVYFAGIGWVTFDPTPPRRTGPAASASEAPALTDRLLSGAASSSVRLPIRRPESGLPAPAKAAHGGGGGWAIAGAAVAIALVALAAWLLRSARRVRRGLAGDASGAVAELVAALRALGYPVAPRTTLAQLERRLATTRGPDAARYVRLLAARRYTGAPPSVGPSRQQRSAFRRALSQGRGPGARLVSLLVLPPAL